MCQSDSLQKMSYQDWIRLCMVIQGGITDLLCRISKSSPQFYDDAKQAEDELDSLRRAYHVLEMDSVSFVDYPPDVM